MRRVIRDETTGQPTDRKQWNRNRQGRSVCQSVMTSIGAECHRHIPHEYGKRRKSNSECLARQERDECRQPGLAWSVTLICLFASH
jgi:hypothetical protein